MAISNPKMSYDLNNRPNWLAYTSKSKTDIITIIIVHFILKNNTSVLRVRHAFDELIEHKLSGKTFQTSKIAMKT